MINNFTPKAQQVLVLAQKEADRLNHPYVGTEHLLLGLIKHGQGVVVNVLQEMGLDLETVRQEVERRLEPNPAEFRRAIDTHLMEIERQVEAKFKLSTEKPPPRGPKSCGAS